ncbi:MAG TPA: hypothetical protein VHG72_13000 [Polyangia bacterium]|nr:hypothetical protein [Polyangia bacterium]
MNARPRSGLSHSTPFILLALALGTGAACAGNSSGTTGTGGSTGTGSGGSTSTGTGGSGSTGTGGSSGTGTGGSTSTGTGGTTAGTGGSSSTGTGGSSTGTGGSATGTGGSSPGTGGSVASGFCPSGAIFCADFEEASGVPNNNPVGTATFEDPSEYGWTFGGATMAAMTLDSSTAYDGKQSLKINPNSGFGIRTLAVAVPKTFWVRLYIKSDMAIGQPDHNSFYAAGVDPDYSKANNVELSEQFNCVLLNKSDSLYPQGTTCTTNTALAANQWHCMTAQFDGATGNVQVYSGSTQIINATAWAPAMEAFTTFSFGYFSYNANSATVWYDDVVVSASQLSCP